MLFLRLEFLTGRYVATSFHDRLRAEWPPHPSRLYSALAATHFEGRALDETGRALRWLEQQVPPTLTCSEASARDVKTHYVPVNDGAASDTSPVSNAWSAYLIACESTGSADKRTTERLTRAYAKAGERSKKSAKSDSKRGRHLLPATRTRQPRSFPCVVPEDSTVHFGWNVDPTPEIRSGLERLAACLVRLGHSSSLVSAAWSSGGPAPDLVPRELGGHLLRWVSPGQLDTLEGMHGAHPYAEQRIMPYMPVRYGRALDEAPQPRSCFSDEFLVLRRTGGPRLPIAVAERVAEAVRQALMSHADDPVPALLSGHAEDGTALQGDHLAVVPLPFVGSTHATGDLLGVALVPPRSSSLNALQPIHRALAKWESGSEPPRVALQLGSLGVWELARELDESELKNLRPRTWSRAASVFTSATPVVLDRHPGSVRRAGSRAEARAEDSVRRACERIGVPPPITVELSQSPFLPGAEHARCFVRRAGSQDHRPLLHVRLRFAERVQGPLLLGAGRYRGLGLLRPERGRDE